MSFCQLDSPIYVRNAHNDLTGRALGWLDTGPDCSLIWIVRVDGRNGEVWLWKNEEVRVEDNWTMDYDQ